MPEEKTKNGEEMIGSSWFKTTKRRWSGNDKHWGPFTFSGRYDSSYRTIGVVIDSGEDGDKCHVRFYLYKYTLILETPGLVKPGKEWNDTSMYSWSKPEGGYWKEIGKEYGFQYSKGFLQLFYGVQTDSSRTTKSWSRHLPWTQWRSHRLTIFSDDGSTYYTELDSERKKFEVRWEAEKTVPKKRFKLIDYDDAEIVAETYITEREYRFGTGRFKWLSFFRKHNVQRRLEIKFDQEVGPEKGSWKGGTTGSSTPIGKEESLEMAFARYCGEKHRSKNGSYHIKAWSAL